MLLLPSIILPLRPSISLAKGFSLSIQRLSSRQMLQLLSSSNYSTIIIKYAYSLQGNYFRLDSRGKRSLLRTSIISLQSTILAPISSITIVLKIQVSQLQVLRLQLQAFYKKKLALYYIKSITTYSKAIYIRGTSLENRKQAYIQSKAVKLAYIAQI